ncbi:hypothetical protein [Desulfonatronospira sp.]|uniref:hypothetical protein n=1 Tax=Desulfonatronospira sp. TaxID=1962951 RepID=UPI0025C00786|nr:hypothetical protein [Desulfonatronospira sp.]
MRKVLSLILILPISCILLVASEAKGQTAINWKEAFVTVESNMQAIEGHEGHFIGIMHQRGFAFYEDGETATVKVWLTFERSGPETKYSGYAVYNFLDDTTKVVRLKGSGDPRGKQTGEFVFKGGTGRFEGIDGGGAFQGQGFPPHGDIHVDVNGTYSLP